MSRLDPSAAPRRGLRGAWWIALAAGLFFVAVAVVQIGEVVRSRGRPRIGDGRDPATYGFDLDSLVLDRRWLAAGMPNDGLRPLDTPPLLTAAGVDSLNRAERGKYLVSRDLVIGVAVPGAARAYPVRVLDWHEVANDTLGGVPLAVCWHPLSGAAVVLDRRRPGREPLALATSGLLWNSHHLLHDADRSLWAPLLARAVAGPATGDTLAVIPAALVEWAAWRAAFPATTVPWPEPAQRAAYKRDPYGNYRSGDRLRFPVAPLAPLAPGAGLKDPLAVGETPARGLPFARRHAYRFALAACGLI